MNLFIAIMSGKLHAERDAAVRDTWYPWARRNAGVGFFKGYLEGRHNLARKFYFLVLTARLNKIDCLITVDNDTLFVPRPENLGFLASHDYIGNVRDMSHPFAKRNGAPYAHGSCFALSARAMDAIFQREHFFSDGVHDTAVGRALKHAQIAVTHTDRIKTKESEGVPDATNDIIATHWLTPTRMRELSANVRYR